MLSAKYGKTSDLKDLRNFDKNLRTNIKIYKNYIEIIFNYKWKLKLQKLDALELDLRHFIKEVV